MNESCIPKIDSLIRFFLYVLIFWLPYSSAVVEWSVIFSLALWIIKRSVLNIIKYKPDQTWSMRVRHFIQGFSPAPSPINRYITIFLVVCIISVIFSKFFAQGWHNFLTKTLEWFIIYFLVLEVFKTKKQLAVVLTIFLVTTFATALDAIIQVNITHTDIFNGRILGKGGRATASFKAPAGLGAYFTVVIPFMVSLLLLRSKRLLYRFTVGLVLFFSLWALALTFTRGAWLATLVGLILFMMMLLKVKNKVKSKHYSLRNILLVCFVFVVLFSALSLNTKNFGFWGRKTAHWRLGVWADSMKMVKERPIIGHGVNTYMALFQEYRRKRFGKYDHWPTYAHNCYLQILVETGLLGLVAFLALLWKYFHFSLRNLMLNIQWDYNLTMLSLGLLSGIFAFLIHSFFDTHFYSIQLSAYIWYIMGLQIITCQLGKLK